MYKLFIGPISKNVVDVIIENDLPIGFIPSRRQIEYDGGYVNNWTTETFSKYVNGKKIIQRDHGGPLQGSIEDDGIQSLKQDCLFFDSIHIDPWKLDNSIEKTISLIKMCYSINPNIKFEVGTEQDIYYINDNMLNDMLLQLKKNLTEKEFDNITHVVIQSGTSLKEITNTGKYSKERLLNQIKICRNFGKKSKEHNGDYMKLDILEDKFINGLDSINIAPELGNLETRVILNNITDNVKLKWFDICLKSGKWKKWVDKDFIPEDNKIKTIEICGHYTFSNKMINTIRYSIIEDIKNELKNRMELMLKIIERNSNDKK